MEISNALCDICQVEFAYEEELGICPITPDHGTSCKLVITNNIL